MPISASAARIRGDDYQHLFAWFQALRMLDPNSGVTEIEIEAPNAGNVDDVIVHMQGRREEFYQVKYSVDASKPIDSAWLLRPQTSNGTSPLQKLWKSWRNLKAAEVSPRLALYTNRPLDVNDPLLKLRDGQRNTLTPRAAEVTPSSGAGKRMREWAEHIGANQEELLEMLSNLEIHTEVSLLMLQERTSDRMAANHLQHDTDAVERGVSTIRAWVIAGVRRVDRGALITKIEEKKLRGDVRRANLVVQAIDHWPLAESATASRRLGPALRRRRPDDAEAAEGPGTVEWQDLPRAPRCGRTHPTNGLRATARARTCTAAALVRGGGSVRRYPWVSGPM